MAPLPDRRLQATDLPGAKPARRRENWCNGVKGRGPQSPLCNLGMVYPIHYSRRFSKNRRERMFRYLCRNPLDCISAGGWPLENQIFSRFTSFIPPIPRKPLASGFLELATARSPHQDRTGNGKSPFASIDFAFLTQSQFQVRPEGVREGRRPSRYDRRELEKVEDLRGTTGSKM